MNRRLIAGCLAAGMMCSAVAHGQAVITVARGAAGALMSETVKKGAAEVMKWVAEELIKRITGTVYDSVTKEYPPGVARNSESILRDLRQILSVVPAKYREPVLLLESRVQQKQDVDPKEITAACEMVRVRLEKDAEATQLALSDMTKTLAEIRAEQEKHAERLTAVENATEQNSKAIEALRAEMERNRTLHTKAVQREAQVEALAQKVVQEIPVAEPIPRRQAARKPEPVPVRSPKIVPGRTYQVRTDVGRANVRAFAGTSAEIIDELAAGTRNIEVTGNPQTADDEQWAPISYRARREVKIGQRPLPILLLGKLGSGIFKDDKFSTHEVLVDGWIALKLLVDQ